MSLRGASSPPARPRYEVSAGNPPPDVSLPRPALLHREDIFSTCFSRFGTDRPGINPWASAVAAISPQDVSLRGACSPPANPTDDQWRLSKSQPMRGACPAAKGASGLSLRLPRPAKCRSAGLAMTYPDVSLRGACSPPARPTDDQWRLSQSQPMRGASPAAKGTS